MKIAIFSESYKPHISGVTRSIEVISKGLADLGHEIFLFVPKYPGIKENETNIFRIPSIPTKYPGFRIAVPYPGMIPDIKFDIVHSHSPFQLGHYSMNYAKRKNIPYVYTFHTLFTEYLHYIPLPKAISNELLGSSLKKFCNKCNTVIVPNTKIKEYLGTLKLSAPIAVVPSGVEFDKTKAASCFGIRKQLRIPDIAKVLIYVGRLTVEKNIEFLFDSFRETLLKKPDTFLVLVAGGPEEENFKRMVIEKNIESKVVFAGTIPYPQVLNYYKCADLFVFSSKTETQGLVIAEAKACGLPVVAVAAQGVVESVNNGVDGFLVKEDPKEFSSKVLEILNDASLWKKMSEQAVKNSYKEFSSDLVAKKMETVYNSLKIIKKIKERFSEKTS